MHLNISPTSFEVPHVRRIKFQVFSCHAIAILEQAHGKFESVALHAAQSGETHVATQHQATTNASICQDRATNYPTSTSIWKYI